MLAVFLLCLCLFCSSDLWLWMPLKVCLWQYQSSLQLAQLLNCPLSLQLPATCPLYVGSPTPTPHPTPSFFAELEVVFIAFTPPLSAIPGLTRVTRVSPLPLPPQSDKKVVESSREPAAGLLCRASMADCDSTSCGQACFYLLCLV